MKLTFKNSLLSFTFCFYSSCFASTTQNSFALISGNPLPWQKVVTNRFLRKHQLNHDELVRWDLENKNCEKRGGVALQLCFRNDQLIVVGLNKDRLAKTLGRLVQINSEKEDRIKYEKRPSGRGPNI